MKVFHNNEVVFFERFPRVGMSSLQSEKNFQLSSQINKEFLRFFFDRIDFFKQ